MTLNDDSLSISSSQDRGCIHTLPSVPDVKTVQSVLDIGIGTKETAEEEQERFMDSYNQQVFQIVKDAGKNIGYVEAGRKIMALMLTRKEMMSNRKKDVKK